jgi:uncharacterized membrane protein
MVSYNQIAGRGIRRIEALSDGLFAIAMTLIVLEIGVPDPTAVGHDEQALWTALVHLGPRILTYAMSFLTLGIFWNGQQTQLHYLERADRNFTWIQLAFLAAVATMPFSTSLLAEFIDLRTALLIYWLDLLALGVLLLWGWNYAVRHRLVRDEVTPEISAAVRRRIVSYQAAYAFAFAVSLMPAGTLVGIGLIVLTQLNSALAPRIPIVSRF